MGADCRFPGDAMTEISVAVCTRNRARLLRSALQSLASAEPPHTAWEVVVVLNACADQSAEVVSEFAGVLPIRVVGEPRAGVSHARNRAVATVQGDLIVWLDDDVRIGAGLLTAYERIALEKPEAQVFGGAIVPVFEDGPPAWLHDAFGEVSAAFAFKQPPDGGGPIVATESIPWGANFAIRAGAQRAHPYDPRLGRQPGHWVLSGEETDVIEKVLATSAGAWAPPEATVEHIMPPARQTESSVYAYFLGIGWMEGRGSPRDGRSAASAAHELAAAVRLDIDYHRRRRVAPPGEWAALFRERALSWGRWRGRWLAQALDP
jgi:hypothetical protein